ncbi:MAG: TRAP transporter large permease subunit [Synergistaceae bacterium]|nr:TRAP transporter large permease subunit [Synergistaceae bacterium]MBQ3448401.1 TRAP transporter large permease subunit [Synergistaceae bacterium]
MCVLNLVFGLTTPPVGVCLFITTSIGKISIAEGTKAIIPFLICNFAVLLLVTYVPPVTLWLVGLLYGI